jgi:hypothetical protein
MLVRLRVEGLERDLIAEALGRPQSAVSGRTWRLKALRIIENTVSKGRFYRLCDGGLEALNAWHHRDETGNGYRHGFSLKDRVAGLWNHGLGHREIAATLRRAPGTARKVLSDLRQEGEIGYAHRPWTEDELAALRTCDSEDVARLALKLGRTAEAVLTKRRGLKRKGDNG